MKINDWDSTYLGVDVRSDKSFEYVSEYKQYALMQPTVDAICESLTNDPHSWRFSTNTFKQKGTDVEYWSSLSISITDIWTGHTTEQVFSYDQGIQIRNAYEIARSKQASASQEKIMKTMFKSEKTELVDKADKKKWWEFWK